MQQLKQPEQGRIRLGFYPYTYVRVMVMRTLLLKREDYEKFLKMSFPEIAEFLQHSPYKKEIDALATEYAGADLLELAFNKNLAEIFRKLIRISSPEIALLVSEYAKRRDIDDLKTVLRGKFTDADEKSVMASLTGAGTFGPATFMSLFREAGVEEILRKNGIVGIDILKPGLDYLREKNSLIMIENILDSQYYLRLLRFGGRLGKEAALFKKFILNEVAILNLLMLFRMKRAKIEKGLIRGFLIHSGDRTVDALLAELADTDDIMKAMEMAEKTRFEEVVRKGGDEFRKSGSLMVLEAELYKYLLKQSQLALHQYPLSVDVILDYMFAKDIEVRNLKILVKGKQLGLSEEFIASQIIV